MIKWEEWDNEILKKDGRLKLVFLKEFGQEESEYVEKAVFGRKGIETLSNMYQPIMVDIDERPDIAIKYLIESAPTISILTQDGRILCGGGFTNYEHFIKFMTELGVLIHREKDIVLKYGPDDIAEDIEEGLSFGNEIISKMNELMNRLAEDFLKSQVISSEICIEILEMFLNRGDERNCRNTLHLLDKIEDKVEGGIFSGARLKNPKISTKKRAILNARYAKLLYLFHRKFKDETAKSKFEQIYEFLKTLYNGEYFYSCISEDSEYYKSTKSIRDLKQKPQTDTRFFCDVNCEIAQNLAEIGDVELAEKILNKIDEKLIEKENSKIKKVYHSDRKNVSNLLTDLSQLLLTYSVLFNIKDDKNYKNKAEQIIEILKNKMGKVLYFEFNENGFGFLKKKKVDVVSNIKIAQALKNLQMQDKSNKIKNSLIPYVQKDLLSRDILTAIKLTNS